MTAFDHAHYIDWKPLATPTFSVVLSPLKEGELAGVVDELQLGQHVAYDVLGRGVAGDVQLLQIENREAHGRQRGRVGGKGVRWEGRG